MKQHEMPMSAQHPAQAVSGWRYDKNRFMFSLPRQTCHFSRRRFYLPPVDDAFVRPRSYSRSFTSRMVSFYRTLCEHLCRRSLSISACAQKFILFIIFLHFDIAANIYRCGSISLIGIAKLFLWFQRGGSPSCSITHLASTFHNHKFLSRISQRYCHAAE